MMMMMMMMIVPALDLTMLRKIHSLYGKEWQDDCKYELGRILYYINFT